MTSQLYLCSVQSLYSFSEFLFPIFFLLFDVCLFLCMFWLIQRRGASSGCGERRRGWGLWGAMLGHSLRSSQRGLPGSRSHPAGSSEELQLTAAGQLLFFIWTFGYTYMKIIGICAEYIYFFFYCVEHKCKNNITDRSINALFEFTSWLNNLQ